MIRGHFGAMAKYPNYPPDVEYREPRPRTRDATGPALIAAIIGGLLTRSAAGAAAGGILGAAAAGEQALPLETALSNWLAQQGLAHISLSREGPFVAVEQFSSASGYWQAISRPIPTVLWTQEALDDWIYGDIVQQVRGWQIAHQSH